MNLLKKHCAGRNACKASSANVVDGKLIMTFPDAVTPVLWQMDLADAKASALEVREGKAGGFTLTLKTAKGETLDIAPFENKEQAVDGLMAASRALNGAQGQIRPAGLATTGMLAGVQAPAPRPHAHRGGWGGVVITLLVIAALFFVWTMMSASRTSLTMDESGLSGPLGAESEKTQESGVPLSADEFLRKQ